MTGRKPDRGPTEQKKSEQDTIWMQDKARHGAMRVTCVWYQSGYTDSPCYQDKLIVSFRLLREEFVIEIDNIETDSSLAWFL